MAAAGVTVGVAPAALPSPNPACDTPAGVLAVAARNAGLPADRIVDAVAIAGAESSYRLTAQKVDSIESSYGPWQVNRDAHPHWPADVLMTADGAARAMVEISGNGATWRPWTMWANGGYRNHLAEAEAVAHCVDAAPATDSTSSTGGPLEVDGLTLRVTDRLLGRALNGWERFGRWVTGRQPDAAPLVARVDAELHELTAPAGGQPTAPTIPQGLVVGGVVCPVPDGHVLDGWGSPRSGGRSHAGADIAGDMGQPVVAPFDARVVDTTDHEADGGLGGISVWLEATSGPHKGTWVYLAHNSRNTARVGQVVRQGEQVAELGATGNARGGTPHVHAQVHPNGGGPVPATALETACEKETQP